MDTQRGNILVIHPKDPTTDFLCPIYRDINATVLRHKVSKSKLKKLMKEADRIIMMGHGTERGLGIPNGLYLDSYIDSNFVYLLREKEDSVFIWCHADKFVEKYNLKGFTTGMFISEEEEADFYKVLYKNGEIEKSNNDFAKIVSEHILNDGKMLHRLVYQEYRDLDSKVTEYNRERLKYNGNTSE